MKPIQNFGRKLSFIYIISIVGPFLLVVLVSSLFFYRMYRQETYSLNSSLLASTANNVETYLKELNSLTTAPYAYEELMNYMVEMGASDEPGDTYHRYQMEQRYMHSISKIIYLNHDDILSIIYIPFSSDSSPSNTAVVISKGISDPGPLEDAVLANQDWQQTVISKNGGSYFSYADDLTYDTSPLLEGNLFFSASRLLRDGVTGRSVGIFRVDVYDKNLRNIFENLEVSSNSNLILLDEGGEMIYHTRDVSDDVLQKLSDRPEHITGSEAFTAQYYSLPSANWTLVSLSSEKDLRRLATNVFLFAAAVTLVFLAVSTASYRSGSRSMVQNVNQILKVLEQVEHGDLSVRARISGTDQLAVIGNALNRMTDRLQEYINREYISVIRQKEMEYLALQSQINPHFLYNVLNSISIMNTLGEKGKVQETISNLTKLMRYSCLPKKDSTLSQETAFIEQYLQLQCIRFSDRLKYEIQVEAAAGDCIIPKFLIQPLVENSIVHGMEPYDIPVLIQVGAALEQDFLKLTISDTGVGFHTEEPAYQESVGLGNVKSRLALFDPDSAFELVSSPESGTTITITLKAVYHTQKKD